MKKIFCVVSLLFMGSFTAFAAGNTKVKCGDVEAELDTTQVFPKLTFKGIVESEFTSGVPTLTSDGDKFELYCLTTPMFVETPPNRKEVQSFPNCLGIVYPQAGKQGTPKMVFVQSNFQDRNAPPAYSTVECK